MIENHAEQSQRPLPGVLSSGWIMARLFLRLTLGSRRIIWLVLILLVPLGMSLAWRIGDDGSGMEFFLDLTVSVLLQFYALGLPLYFGVSAIRNEIDDRTIVYLFARPIRRSVVLAGKIFSVALMVGVSLVVTMVFSYLIAVSADGVDGLVNELDRLLVFISVIALASLVYTSLFSAVGVLFSKPMIPAIILGFGWEAVMTNMPGGFPKVTVMFHLKSLLGVGPDATGLMSVLIPPTQPASTVEALITLGIATTLFLAVGLMVGSQKEYPV